MSMMLHRRFGWLVLLWALASGSVMAAAPVATVVAVTGKATVVRSAGGQREALAFKMPVYLNDRIQTEEQALVKLLLNDDSILKVSPASELHVSELVVGPGDESRTTVNLLKGKLRSLVGKKLGANSRFEVHTSVAVAGVRGTDFEVLSQELTTVRCFEGRVEVANLRKDIVETVMLTANTFTRVLPDQAPTQPEYIAPGEVLGSKGEAGSDEEAGDAAEAEQALEQGEMDAVDSPDTSAGEKEFAYEEGLLAGELEKGLLLEGLIEQQVFGDVIQGQVETIVEPAPPGVEIPITITIPQP